MPAEVTSLYSMLKGLSGSSSVTIVASICGTNNDVTGMVAEVPVSDGKVGNKNSYSGLAINLDYQSCSALDWKKSFHYDPGYLDRLQCR